MKRIIFFAILLLPIHVYAKWIDMKMPHNSVFYEDKKLKIDNTDNKKNVSGWILNSLSKPQKIQNINYMSIKAQFEINCTSETLYYEYVVYYSESNGAGNIVFTYKPNIYNYTGEVIVPDSFEEFYVDYFCKKSKN